MNEVIVNLKNKIILNGKNVLELKNYIYNKYPNHSSKELSLVLADGIHKIIYNNMTGFNEEQRVEIEKRIIRDAVNSNDFSISGYKIFCQYIRLNNVDEDENEILIEWVNSIQEKLVIKEELTDLINMVKSYEDIPIEDAVKNVDEPVIENIDSTYINEPEESIIEQSCTNAVLNTAVLESNLKKAGYVVHEFIYNFVLRIVDMFRSYGRKRAAITVSIVIMFFILLNIKQIGYAFINSLGTFKSQNVVDTSNEDIIAQNTEIEKSNGLPKDLRYTEIDEDLLRNWLNKKDSILAEEPYLSSILYAAKEYDINPLFLIAITGQEQGFVPKSNGNALKIANNPFNVYGSWMEYNSNINDSSRVAAQTIINLSKGRPDEVHAIQWINEKYAEDKNWWVGVDKIFNQLKREVTK